MRGLLAGTLLALAACGGSSSGPSLTLSGTVSGLSTSGLTLATLGANLAVSSGAKSFTFGPILNDGTVYDVTVPIQPAGQVCTVTNGTGTATTANIANVVVTCSDRTFTIGGTVSGLTTSGLVLSNGSDTLSVPAGASSFTLPAGVAYGSTYAVSVTAQPTGLTCSVANGTGTVAAAAVTNIAVTCSDQPLAVGGTITGLGNASGLILVNGTERYTVPADATSFSLTSPVAAGSEYAVHVQSEPAGMICSVGQAHGTMPPHDVADVTVICSAQAFGLGGTIAGLTASGLVLSDGAQTLRVPAHSNDFTMPAPIASGAAYALRVVAQPAGLTCTLGDATGTMTTSPVTHTTVVCSSSSYTLGGSILGLTSSGLVLSDGVQSLAVAAHAERFSMPDALAYGAGYAITVVSQPSQGGCRILRGTGSISADVESVQVICGP